MADGSGQHYDVASAADRNGRRPGDITSSVSGDQLDLFAPTSGVLPDGFSYQPDVISSAEETQLLAEIAPLPFMEFQFHGFEGKRRVVSFGWRYDFDENRAVPADPIPPFLQGLCRKVGTAAGFDFGALHQVLVTEYSPGAPIGWHRDRPVFDRVMGLSLGSSCTFRMRMADPDRKWRRFALRLEPRSAYLLTGDARWKWEHSIPPVEALRYSITFRSRRATDWTTACFTSQQRERPHNRKRSAQ